jgi:uncharacterized RDD family membrane protein YckC
MGKYVADFRTTKTRTEILEIIQRYLTSQEFKPASDQRNNLWRKGHLWAQWIKFQIDEGTVHVEAWMNAPIPGMGSFLIYFINKDKFRTTVQEIEKILNDGHVEPQNASGPKEAQYAGFGRRLGAFLLDFLILYFGGALVAVFLGTLINGALRSGGSANPVLHRMTVTSTIGWIFILCCWLYYTIFESSAKQATPGKMALGLKVTGVSGERISFGRANGRFWPKFISSLIVFFGFIMAAFTSKKQALHDLIAGTVVTRKV